MKLFIIACCLSLLALNANAQTVIPASYSDKLTLGKDLFHAIQTQKYEELQKIGNAITLNYQSYKQIEKALTDELEEDPQSIGAETLLSDDSVLYKKFAGSFYTNALLYTLLKENSRADTIGNVYLITDAKDTLISNCPPMNFIALMYEQKETVNIIQITGLMTVKNRLYVARQIDCSRFDKNDPPFFMRKPLPETVLKYKLNGGAFQKYNGDTLLFSNINYLEEIVSTDEEVVEEVGTQEGDKNATTIIEEDIPKQEELKEPEIFDRAEVMPSFPGGVVALMDFIKTHLMYPNLAKENNLEGKVIVKFYIDTHGNVQDPVVLKDAVGGGCADEAIRLCKSMPKWIPGSQRGKNVNCYYLLPITFKLD